MYKRCSFNRDTLIIKHTVNGILLSAVSEAPPAVTHHFPSLSLRFLFAHNLSIERKSAWRSPDVCGVVCVYVIHIDSSVL